MLNIYFVNTKFTPDEATYGTHYYGMVWEYNYLMGKYTMECGIVIMGSIENMKLLYK